jgi:outer membrane protein assembly factor BamB
VIALTVVDGSPIWERRLGGAPNEILALEDRLYVGAQDNFLYCLMTEDGRIDWRWRTGGDVIGLPVVDDNTVYFVSLDNVLRALNRKSGGQRWIRTLPFRPAWAPVKVAGVLVVAGQSPSLRAYALTDGSASGEVTAPAEIAEAPHVVESGATALPTLLVMTRDIKEGAVGLLITRSLEPASTPVTALTPAVELPPLRPPS